LLFDMVKAWDDWVKEGGCPSPIFEKAMCEVFEYRRFKRILAVCLAMERAKCLFLIRDLSLPAKEAFWGAPWFSSWHFRNDTMFARNHPSEMLEFISYLDGYKAYLGDDGSTMKQALFRILFLEPLGLQKDTYFRELSMPAKHPQDKVSKP